jgi:hypothetical protein
MPRKTAANRARADNLRKWKAQGTKATVEEVEDEESVNSRPYSPNSHARPSNPDTFSCQSDDDPELLDIIGALRGAAMIDDEDDISESGSEGDGDNVIDEIHEITALEHFASTLEKAHVLAAAAEREREKGRKRPKTYLGNSVRTKQRCQQRGRELAAKGFHSVKDWLLQMPPSASSSREATACGSPRSDLREESEESASEDEIQPIRPARLSTMQIIIDPEESETDSELGSGTVVGSISKSVEGRKSPKERERLQSQHIVAQMLKDLQDGKTPHDGSEETSMDCALNQLNHKNFPALH